MKIQKDYSLEQLTAESVNVVEISIATINKKPHEIGRSRMAYVNSPTGRKQLTETLPEEYVKAVLRCGVKIPRCPIRPLKEAK